MTPRLIQFSSLRALFHRAPDLWVLLGFGLLTVVLTQPLAWHIGTAMPGLPPDVYLYIWNLEWTRRAIFELGTNPYVTQAVYYPTGVPLYFHSFILGNNLLALPIQFAFGAPAAFMLLTLATFVLSGYGAYLLAFNCVRRRGPAFVAGMIFTFSPYHLAHLNYSHFDLITLQWLPFFALSAKLYLEKPNAKRLALAAVFFVWISLTNWYYAFYAALLLGCLTLFYMLRRRSLAPLVTTLVLVGVYAIVLAPLFYGMAGELGGGTVDPQRALKEADRFSGDLLGFILPTTLHPLWGELVTPLAIQLHGGLAERSIFYGFVPLLLAVWGVIQYRKPIVIFWAVVALLFSLLALGPVLHVLGETEFGANNQQIVLPQALLYRVPIISTVFNIARSISRYSIVAMLGISILAAFGLKAIISNLDPRRGALVVGTVCVLVGIEFAATPAPLTSLTLPSGIEALRMEPKPFATLDLPVDFKSGGESLYFSSVTGAPTTSGYHSQLLGFSLLDGTSALRSLSNAGAGEIVSAPQRTAAELLRFFNIKYVVLHKNASEETGMVESNRAWIEQALGAGPPMEEDARVAVYRVPEAQAPPLVVILDVSQAESPTAGWNGVESFGDNRLWRWMRNDGGVLIYAQERGTAEVSFTPVSFQRPREMQIYFNDALISTETIPSDAIEPLTYTIPLQAGRNELRFHATEPPQQPAALGQGDDGRFLSIGFSDLRVELSSP